MIKVGNEAFADFSVSHGVPIYRVVHHKDPVPHLPFESWGYHHPPTEVFFDADQTSFVVCDDSGEDETCSDQYWVGGQGFHLFWDFSGCLPPEVCVACVGRKLPGCFLLPW